MFDPIQSTISGKIGKIVSDPIYSSKSSILETFNVDTGEPPRIQVLLKVEELLKWKKWSSASKEFLRSQEKELHLSRLIAGYHNNVVSFYGWFGKLLDVEHREEVEEMNALAAKVIAMEKARR